MSFNVNLSSTTGNSTIGLTTALSVSSTGALTINNTTNSTSTTTGALRVAGGLGVEGTVYANSANFVTLTAPHSGLSGLSNDDHTQYSLLAGRSGGQILTGGNGSSNNLVLRSTSDSTKGQIFIDETTASTSTTTGALRVAGGLGVEGTVYANSANFVTLTAPHSGLSGLSNDDHTQYSLLAGRSGGQTLIGGNGSSNNLVLRSTSDSTKGQIFIDETTASTSTTTGALRVAGGLGVEGTVYANSANFVTLTAPHSGLSGLSNDDHTQYSLLAGRSGGQTLTGGNGSSNNLVLRSTTNATKGQIYIDETTVSTSTTTGALRVGGGLGVEGTVYANSANFVTLTAPHSGLSGLSNDDHTQYSLLAGRSGGQTLTGGNGSSNNLVLRSTTNATKGQIYIDETTASTSTTTGALRVAGGLGVEGKMYSGGGITIDGDNTALIVDALNNGRLGIVKKAGAGPYFAIGNGHIFDWRTANDTSIEDVSARTYTSRATLNASGVFDVSGTTASTSSTTGIITTAGGISSSNTTDAVSSTNGGSGTLAGGLAVAKKLFVGTDTSLATNSGITTIGSTTPLTVSADGILNVNNTTVSTSINTGALVVDGGIGLAGKMYSGGGITIDGDNTALIIDAAINGRLGIVKKAGDGPYFAIGSGHVYQWRVGNNSSIEDVSGSTFTTVASLSNTGVFDVLGTTASTSSSTGSITTAGGISSSNTTDAVSSTNGGSGTLAGGLGVAKSLYVGTGANLATVSGITTIGSTTAATISATGVLTVANATDSSNVTSGSTIISGGIGVGKSAYIAGPLDILSSKSGTPSTSGHYLRISASTFTDNVTAASGTATSMVFNSIAAPTLAATNTTVTTTNAASLYIAGGPIAGTNQTISGSYGLWNVGQTFLDNRLVLRNGQFSLQNTTGSGLPSVSGTGFQALSGSFLDTVTASSGTATSFAYASFSGCTLNAQNSSVTTTTASVLYIGNNVAAGTNETITNSYGLWNLGNERIDGRLSIGGNQPTSGANNISKLFITGSDSSISGGPHLAITTASDQYPLYHQLNFAHNNIFAGFDVYYDGSDFRTSHTTNGYAFYKEDNEFRIKYSNSTGAGSTTTLVTGLSMSSTGSVSIPGNLTKGSGTFDIQHPILENKRLIHSFIEGPRCDNIYRGSVTLIDGKATINLDKDCVAESECEMTEGTFEALNTNVTYFLQNHTNFDQVIGNIIGNILEITSNNPNSNATINWMVVGERNDLHIKNWNKTNSNGRLITEYSKN